MLRPRDILIKKILKEFRECAFDMTEPLVLASRYTAIRLVYKLPHMLY